MYVYIVVLPAVSNTPQGIIYSVHCSVQSIQTSKYFLCQPNGCKQTRFCETILEEDTKQFLPYWSIIMIKSKY